MKSFNKKLKEDTDQNCRPRTEVIIDYIDKHGLSDKADEFFGGKPLSSVPTEELLDFLVDSQNIKKESLKEWFDNYDDYEDEDKYSLIGVDGNAYSIMGYTANALKREGLRNLISQMHAEATSGDYDNLIAVCFKYVEMANEAARGDYDDIEESLKESYQVQFANSDDEVFDGGEFDSLEEAKDYAINQFHTDIDCEYFVIYDDDGEIVFDNDDLNNSLPSKYAESLKNTKINIRESLNKIDLRTDNKYDLRNLYDSCILTDKEKRTIAEMIARREKANVLYESLMNKFEGKELKESEFLDTKKVPKSEKAKSAFHDDPTDGMTRADYIDWLMAEKGMKKQEAENRADMFYESLNESESDYSIGEQAADFLNAYFERNSLHDYNESYVSAEVDRYHYRNSPGTSYVWVTYEYEYQGLNYFTQSDIDFYLHLLKDEFPNCSFIDFDAHKWDEDGRGRDVYDEFVIKIVDNSIRTESLKESKSLTEGIKPLPPFNRQNSDDFNESAKATLEFIQKITEKLVNKAKKLSGDKLKKLLSAYESKVSSAIWACFDEYTKTGTGLDNLLSKYVEKASKEADINNDESIKTIRKFFGAMYKGLGYLSNTQLAQIIKKINSYTTNSQFGNSVTGRMDDRHEDKTILTKLADEWLFRLFQLDKKNESLEESESLKSKKKISKSLKESYEEFTAYGEKIDSGSLSNLSWLKKHIANLKPGEKLFIQKKGDGSLSSDLFIYKDRNGSGSYGVVALSHYVDSFYKNYKTRGPEVHDLKTPQEVIKAIKDIKTQKLKYDLPHYTAYILDYDDCDVIGSTREDQDRGSYIYSTRVSST